MFERRVSFTPVSSCSDERSRNAEPDNSLRHLKRESRGIFFFFLTWWDEKGKERKKAVFLSLSFFLSLPDTWNIWLIISDLLANILHLPFDSRPPPPLQYIKRPMMNAGGRERETAVNSKLAKIGKREKKDRCHADVQPRAIFRFPIDRPIPLLPPSPFFIRMCIRTKCAQHLFYDFFFFLFLRNDRASAERNFFFFFFDNNSCCCCTTNLGIPISWWRKKKEMGRWDGRRRIDTTHQLVGSLASPICWQTKSVKKRRERESLWYIWESCLWRPWRRQRRRPVHTSES